MFDKTREPFYPFREARDLRLLEELDLTGKVGVQGDLDADQGGQMQAETDIEPGGADGAAPGGVPQAIRKEVKGATVFHTLADDPQYKSLWRQVVCGETYDNSDDPGKRGELIERMYVKGKKPKKLTKAIPDADPTLGRDVAFLYHFTDPTEENADTGVPDGDEGPASAGDGDAAEDPLQNGAPQEEIEGFIR